MSETPRWVEIACEGGNKAPKKVAMDIATRMQDWVKERVEARLKDQGLDELKVSSVGKAYAGGWRGVSVDVHIQKTETGLLLALDPKHLQSLSSIRKNWQNMLNDIVAFGGNLHTRFPMAVVGAMVGFNKAEIDDKTLKNMYSIFGKVATRRSPYDQAALLEGVALVIYECDPVRISPDMPPKDSPFRWTNMLDRAVNMLVQRYV